MKLRPYRSFYQTRYKVQLYCTRQNKKPGSDWNPVLIYWLQNLPVEEIFHRGFADAVSGTQLTGFQVARFDRSFDVFFRDT